MAREQYLDLSKAKEGEWPGSIIVELDKDEIEDLFDDNGKLALYIQHKKEPKPGKDTHFIMVYDIVKNTAKKNKNRSIRVDKELDAMQLRNDLPF